MFSVVEFISKSEKKQLDIVPITWIKDGMCPWPTRKQLGQISIQEYIRAENDPKEDWKQLAVKMLCSFGKLFHFLLHGDSDLFSIKLTPREQRFSRTFFTKVPYFRDNRKHCTILAKFKV